MTRVDFYVIGAGRLTPMTLTCRLCEKAVAADQHVLVHSQDAAAAASIDRELWTFNDVSFVPHRTSAAPHAGEPVVIGQEPAEELRPDLVINLDASVPEWVARYARAIEVVPPDVAGKALARERFRFYKERGYPMHTHEVGA